jgi:NADH-quinone oxidoreductase subunit B
MPGGFPVTSTDRPVDLGLPSIGPVQNVAPYPLRLVLNWGRRYSLWVFNFGLACCAIEFIAASTSRHDFIRLGVIPFAHGPRQADLMIVSGTVTDKMAPAVRRLYEQMPEPKYVISFGACSNSGGPYWDSYCVTKGVDQIIPVDVYVPGCPPRPESLLQSIVKLQEKIAGENLARKYRKVGRGGHPVSGAEVTRPLVGSSDGSLPASRRVRRNGADDGGVRVMPSALPPVSPVQAVTLRPHVPAAPVVTAPPAAPVVPARPAAPATPPLGLTVTSAEDTADMPSPLLPDLDPPATQPPAEPTLRTRLEKPEEGPR